MTRYQLHTVKWKDGCGTSHCGKACRRVFARGSIPCDVLFVGEAPGESENVVGQPFVGPAGKLLDKIVSRGLNGVLCFECGTIKREFPNGDVICENGHRGVGRRITSAFTNVVACIPREGSEKASEPDHEQIESCKPRLEEMIALARPRLIVAVGKVAQDALEQGYKHSTKIPAGCKVANIKHPAAILRGHVAQQGLDVQRCVVTISNAVEELS